MMVLYEEVGSIAAAVASSVLATPHFQKWLDGVSDALTDFLRRLRETHPSATAKIRPGPTPTADVPAFASLSMAGSDGHLYPLA